MKNANRKLFTMAATLAIAAATASAQGRVDASVPFSFTAGSKQVLAAGDYSIRQAGNFWYVVGKKTRHSNVAVATAPVPSQKTDGAKLVFLCRDNGCSLSEIQVGGGVPGAQFSQPKRSKSGSEEEARVVVVPAAVSSSN